MGVKVSGRHRVMKFSRDKFRIQCRPGAAWSGGRQEANAMCHLEKCPL